MQTNNLVAADIYGMNAALARYNLMSNVGSLKFHPMLILIVQKRFSVQNVHILHMCICYAQLR